jgi:hypothetical protein
MTKGLMRILLVATVERVNAERRLEERYTIHYEQSSSVLAASSHHRASVFE